MTKEEKVMFGSSVVYLKFLTAEEYNKLNNPIATTTHCFPIKNDEVLFTVNQRGVDIIGGHIEPGENAIQALLRESMEEASIIPTEYDLVGAIRVDNRDCLEASQKRGYAPIGYQLMYVVKQYIENEFNITHESTERKYINIEDIKKVHHSWTKTHQAVLDECVKVNKKPKFKIN